MRFIFYQKSPPSTGVQSVVDMIHAEGTSMVKAPTLQMNVLRKTLVNEKEHVFFKTWALDSASSSSSTRTDSSGTHYKLCALKLGA